MKFQVQNVRKAPTGFSADTLALVTFSFEPDRFNNTLTASRAHKNDKGEWRDYPSARFSFADGSSVQIIDAKLMRGDKGPWLAVSNFDVNDDVRRGVAEAAYRKLEVANEGAGEQPQNGNGRGRVPQTT